MKVKLLKALTAVLLFLGPIVSFGQAPTLGTAANFVLFSTAGAVTNSGIPHLTHLTGNVGTNSGSSTGFGNVDGQMHDGDVASGACAADLTTLYGQLNSAIPTFFPSSLLGNGDTLAPGIYYIPSAATLNLNLVLNAMGNANAVFIFQIQGSLSTGAFSNVKLINGGLACNVFWKVEGLVSMATGTTMKGTIVAHNAAISMGVNDSLEGRALSINGSVTTNSILAYTPIGCGSAVLTGPAAPALVSTAAYGVFSSIGPVTATGITYVTGDVGTNSGLTTGFNPLFVTGMIHPIPDASTAACASDLTNVYNYLNGLPADIDLLYPAQFGNDLVLTPHTYHLGAATTFTGNIYLNAEGHPNAVFVIQINGALNTSTFSKVILMNGTQAKNVYWKVDGAVHIYDNSVFNGTIVGAGAITLNTGDTLNGRALTINGAVNINGSYINITPPACVAAPITGVQPICVAATIPLADNDTGGTWASTNPAIAAIGSVSGIVTGMTAGVDTIIYTSPLACVSTTTITVNASPSPISGANTVCIGSPLILSDATTGGSWSSSNLSVATVGSISGVVSGVSAGTANITYSLAGGCIATKTITVNTAAIAGTISGPSIVCTGSIITLTDGVAGGAWSASNSKATVVGGTVTGVTAGIDTIIYTVTSGCGTATTTKTITVNASSGPGSISGPSGVCTGSFITLTDGTAGGAWSASNSNAAVIGGIVTGVTAGVDTIMYTVTGGCGTTTATKTITVNASPDAGSISGPSGVCTGAFITLTDGATGGAWSASNSNAAVIGGVATGVTAGIDTIMYTVTNGCGTATATKTVTVNALPNAGSVSGASSVCTGSFITLTDGAAGGAWSASNGNAAVIGGIVTGVAAGVDTIMYTVTGGCGTATATKTITINTLPNAGSISGLSTVCVSSIITLTDAATGGAWSASNSSAGVAGGVVTGTTAGIDTIMYTVTSGCGSSTATKTITVNALPNAGSIGGLSAVCAGSSITLTNAAAGGAWSASNGSAGVSGGVVTGVTAGIDTIKYTVSDGCGIAATTKTITVNPLTNPGSISGLSAVCVGSSITLTDGAAGGAWSVSNTNATISGGAVTGTTAGVDTVIYSVTGICGTATATKTVTVNPLPDAGNISGLSSVCVGANISLTDGVTGGTWTGSNAAATVAGGVVTGASGGTDTIRYAVTNICGIDVATKRITVIPMPDAGTIIGSAGVCIGLPLVLTDAVSGGNWSSSNVKATVSGGIVTGASSGTDTIRYTVNNVCGTAVAIMPITVNLLPFTPAISTQSPSSVCSGTMYQNFGTATAPSANIVYNWTAVNATVWAEGTLHQYALISFNTPGAAYVTLNATLSGTACASHNMITVNVGEDVAPTAEVSYFNSHFVCTPNNEGSYQWGYDDAHSLDSTILTGEINEDYINTNPDFSNKYYWVMTSAGSCAQKTYYRVPTTVQNINSAAGISVYPNPAHSVINVDITAAEHSSIQVVVYNMLGQQVATVRINDNSGTIDVAGLPAGSYVVSCFRNGIAIAHSRFIKQ